MPNDKIKNNISQEENKGCFEIWVGDDDIVKVKVGEKKWDYNTMEKVLGSYDKIINGLTKNLKL